jgi:C1A family cysteine protease
MDWNHAMLIFGYDDASRRKGACFLNSWGDVHGGPTLHDNPPTCSFWVDKNVVEVGLKNVWQRQSNPDSYALSNYVGYPYQADKIPDYTFW